MIARRISLFMSLLICALSARGQSPLVFRETQWDFGTIAEEGGRVSHTFACENRGREPVVIVEVVASCGCTAPEFSRKPILPGASSEVKVTYDPANRPGVFLKELGVYDASRERIATLTIRGDVTPRPRSIEERYPFEVGRGLRLNTDMHAFSYIYKGVPVQTAVGYVNASDSPVELEIRVRGDRYVTVDYPRRIQPGEEGEIGILCSVPKESGRYGSLHSTLSFLVDRRNTRTPFSVYGIAVDDPAGGDPAHAPKALPDPFYLRFGEMKRAGGPQHQRFVLSNPGTATLTVRAVELDLPALSTTLVAGTTVRAGGQRSFEVTVDPARAAYGSLVGYLMLITDDPDRPMRKIRISAIVEE